MAWLKCPMGSSGGNIPVGTVLYDYRFSGVQYGSEQNQTITIDTDGIDTLTLDVYGAAGVRGTGYVYTNFYVFNFYVDEVAKVSAGQTFGVSSNRDDQWHWASRHYTVTLTNLAATTQLRFYVWWNPGGEWWDGTGSGQATVTVTDVS